MLVLNYLLNNNFGGFTPPLAACSMPAGPDGGHHGRRWRSSVRAQGLPLTRGDGGGGRWVEREGRGGGKLGFC
jgi:hypothetical protein